MRYLMTLFLVALCATVLHAAPTTYTLNATRVAEIASSLSPTPEGPLRPITDRAFWTAMATEPGYNQLIKTARELKDKPVEVIPEDLFLEFSRNGNRRNYEAKAFERRRRLAPLVMAECMENKGTFLPAINNLLDHFNRERTWVLPAHDKKLTNFNGTLVTIDLFSSDLAWELAITEYLLGDKITHETRMKLRTEINRQVIQPYFDMIHHRRKLDGWLTNTNNWNSVCHNNVLGCALHLVSDRNIRAEFITAAEHYSKYFLEGFTPDGYCSEGVGYWNYGYGRFAQMGMYVRFATQGKVDFFQMPGAGKPATYGPQIEVVSGISPSFADCSLRAQPSHPLLCLLNKVYGWKQPAYAQISPAATVSSLGELTSYFIALQDKTPALPGNPLPSTGGIRTVFEQAGVFIMRLTQPTAGLAVAFKGGNNDEHHNHNDLGSYLVVHNGEAPLLDPGAETYTARTFSKDRYVSRLLNSYGHAVPVVAGKLQEAGKNRRGKIARKEFTDTKDTVVINLRSAYKVPELDKLTRTFEFDRTGKGSFTVTDEVKFKSPQAFETALVSLGNFDTRSNARYITVTSGKSRLRVAIEASTPYSLKPEAITETSTKPNRLGVALNEKVMEATVKMVITPDN